MFESIEELDRKPCILTGSRGLKSLTKSRKDSSNIDAARCQRSMELLHSGRCWLQNKRQIPNILLLLSYLLHQSVVKVDESCSCLIIKECEMVSSICSSRKWGSLNLFPGEMRSWRAQHEPGESLLHSKLGHLFVNVSSRSKSTVEGILVVLLSDLLSSKLKSMKRKTYVVFAARKQEVLIQML